MAVPCSRSSICLAKTSRTADEDSSDSLRFFCFKLADDTRKITYRTMFTLHIDGSLHLPLVLILSVLVAQHLIRKLSKKQEKHKYHPVGGTVFNQLLNFNRLHHYMTNLARKYKTYRLIAPFRSEVYTADPVNVEYILKTNFENYGKGGHNYDNLSGLLGDGIFTVDGDKWRQQRKVSSYEFSTKVLRDFSSVIFRKNVAKLANIVSEAAKANQSMDIQDLFMKSTLDSIFKVAFGVELDSMCGSNEEGVKFTRAFDDASALTLWRYVDVFWKIKRFLNIGSEAALKKNVKVVNDFVYKLINKKIELMRDSEELKKDDILSRFLKVNDNDPTYLRDIILNFVIAGKDTTAAALSWFIYMLCKHPAIQNKIVQEVREATGVKEITDFAEFAAGINEEALEKMNYLHAAISETLRLYPSVPVDTKICFSDDTLPDGFNVRKGDMVAYQPYAMGRMKFVWGDDAEEYKPERWLNKDGVFQPESPFKFTAFQAGPRICLGKEFAYRQMKIFAAVLLGSFIFKLADEKKPVNYRTMINLHVDGGLHNPNYPPVNGTVFGQLFYLNRLYDYQTEAAKKQKTFRLLAPGKSELYTTDIRNIEHVLKTKFDNYTKGKYNQDIFTDLFGKGIFAVDGDKWRQQRKLASFEFSTRVLRDFSCSVFRRNAAKLVRVISKMATADQIFDMQDTLMRCTLDSIFKVGFGVELNCLEGSRKSGTEFMKAFDDSNALVYRRYVDPLWKLKRYLNIGSEASLTKNIKIIDAFVTNLIRTKRKLLAEERLCNDKEDILSRFLVESRKDPEEMNDKYLRDIILNFMIAGKDTSANTLSWFFYMLCKNPVIQEKVAQEVRDVTRSQDDVVNVEEFIANITDTALEQMHYLHAALTETLRMKKGDGLYYLAYAMGRMPYIWGEDAEDFRPERWLNNGVFQPESPFKFIAFHGDHNYDNLSGLLGDGIFVVDGHKWRQQRKVSSYEFSTKVLRDFSSVIFRTNVAKLANIVSEAAKANRSMDIQDLFMKSTLDSIFKVGFGVELDSMCGSNEEGVNFTRAFDDASALTLWRYVDVLWKIKRFLNVGSEAALKKNVKVVNDFVYKLINKKIELMRNSEVSSLKKDDILSRFLQVTENDPTYLRDIILNFVIAGKDTTATALSWFIYMLCKHPAIQNKIAQEVREATGVKEITGFAEFAASITEEALEKMNYLHAAISETLRLYPSVPVDGKICFADDTLPDGFHVRKGDMVAYQPYAMGRMKFVWGDDAEEYKPERWLNKDGEFQPESPFKFTAFQAGPRICLGKDFAYRQMKIFAAELVGCFIFKLADENKPVNYRTMINLHVDGGLHINLHTDGCLNVCALHRNSTWLYICNGIASITWAFSPWMVVMVINGLGFTHQH
uniref:Uncharacterized protein n=1 Tax=Salix viminalis TaxID=40686 RepID=A0A6N2MY13_SALVM